MVLLFTGAEKVSLIGGTKGTPYKSELLLLLLMVKLFNWKFCAGGVTTLLSSLFLQEASINKQMIDIKIFMRTIPAELNIKEKKRGCNGIPLYTLQPH